MERPTYDELVALVAAQAEIIAAQAAEIERLKVRVAELEARLGMKSRNSSKPPSSDGLGKPAPKSLRKKTGRRPGGQPGHEGTTLRQVDDPDSVIVHEPGVCRSCAHSLADAPRVGVERRQVFDLPEIRAYVTEHQLVRRRCRCGTKTTAPGPDRVDAPVQYGPRVLAVIVYLYMGQFLSKARTAQAMSELLGIAVSPGTVSKATERAADSLSVFGDLLGARLSGEPVVHFDETGLRVAGRLHWLHSASSARYSLLFCHRRRGKAAIDAMGVLPAFAGTAVHDAWAPYDTYTTATHALCGAHLLRELQAVTDHHHADTPGTWSWATQTADALLAIKTAVDTSPDHVPAARVLAAQVRRIRDAVLLALDTPARSALERKHHALARRIRDRETDYLRFATDPGVPFDNNAAEREIRMAKIRQKVSGCLRTLTGAEHFAAIRSYTQTATKHGIPMLDALTQLTHGTPWLPA